MIGSTETTDVWPRVRTVLLTLFSLELLILVVTGVILFFVYRPTAAQAWDDIVVLKDGVTFSSRMQDLHRWTSWLLLPTGVAAALAVSLGPNPLIRRATGVLRAVTAAALPGLLSITGFLLAWDQLALFRVTVGDDVEGYRVLFDDDVRFVLIGGTEIVPSTIIRMLVLHVVGALLLAVVVTSLWWSRRSTRS